MITDELLKGYVDNSGSYISWSITLIGASFLLILSDGYYTPKGKKKLIYLGFFPAWIALVFSLYCATKISNNYLATKFIDKMKPSYNVRFSEFSDNINSYYNNQIDSFYIGLSIISMCFATLVVFQIFDNTVKK